MISPGRLDLTTVQTIQLAADRTDGGAAKVAILVTVAPDDEPVVLVMSRGLAEVLGRRLMYGEPAP